MGASKSYSSRAELEQRMLRVLIELAECDEQVRAAQRFLDRRRELDQEMRQLLVEYDELLRTEGV